MRIVLAMTMAMIALLAVPAYAQTPGTPPYMQLPTEKEHLKKEESITTKADERAYRSALDGIKAKRASDPWFNVRDKSQANTSR